MIVQLKKKTKEKSKFLGFMIMIQMIFIFDDSLFISLNARSKSFIFFSSSMTSQLMNYFNNVYTKPQTRASPYLVGTTLGYIIFKKIVFPRNHKLVNFSLQFSIHFFFFVQKTSLRS